jgi:hypothetical protein
MEAVMTIKEKWMTTDDLEWMLSILLVDAGIITTEEYYKIFLEWGGDVETPENLRTMCKPRLEMVELALALRGEQACHRGLTWVRDAGITSLDEVWAKCDNPEWMLWAFDRFGANSHYNVLARERCRGLGVGYITEFSEATICTWLRENVRPEWRPL